MVAGGAAAPPTHLQKAPSGAAAMIRVRLVLQHVQSKMPSADQTVTWVEIFKNITVGRRCKE